MSRTYYISSAFTGKHKEFVDEETLNIRNRLKEVYGERCQENLMNKYGILWAKYIMQHETIVPKFGM